jgi:hypothetical protein
VGVALTKGTNQYEQCRVNNNKSDGTVRRRATVDGAHTHAECVERVLCNVCAE